MYYIKSLKHLEVCVPSCIRIAFIQRDLLYRQRLFHSVVNAFYEYILVCFISRKMSSSVAYGQRIGYTAYKPLKGYTDMHGNTGI